MFTPNPAGGSDKTQFLEQARAARDERERGRRKEDAITTISAAIRGFLARRRLRRIVYAEVDAFLAGAEPATAVDLFNNTRKLLFFYGGKEPNAKEQLRTNNRFREISARILKSLEGSSPDQNYVEALSDKKISPLWIAITKKYIVSVSESLRKLEPNISHDLNAISLYLHVLVTFFNVNSWKLRPHQEHLRPTLNALSLKLLTHAVANDFLANLQRLLLNSVVKQRPLLGRASLIAVATLALRPLALNFSEEYLLLFVVHFLSVPAIVHQMRAIAPFSLTCLQQQNILPLTITTLAEEHKMRSVSDSLDALHALCLLANLVDLSHQMALEDPSQLEALSKDLISLSTRILENCLQYVGKKQSAMSHYHPLLGWFSQKVDASQQEVITHIKSQLQLLWSPTLSMILFRPLFILQLKEPESPPPIDTAAVAIVEVIGMLRRGSTTRSTPPTMKINCPEVRQVALSCHLYETAIACLTELRHDILTGLSFQSNELLTKLWRLIGALGGSAPSHRAKVFLELLQQNVKANAMEFQILKLLCNCASHLLVLLDDDELYIQQKTFSLKDLCVMSAFLNILLFKIISNQLLDLKSISCCPLFACCHSLLMLLYRRDSRRSFTPEDHWLVKTKFTTLVSDFENGKLWAQLILHKLPHVLPHRERVQLFRRRVKQDMVPGGTESTHITVHRSRIVEDGFQQLNALTPQELKGVIRVRFVNYQGLDEAGIDQDGVFKEFLEETILRVFNPALNLFKMTNKQTLYPSPTSYFNENHLELFEFVGKMLGKAVHERIVVDVKFATFFLSQILGHHRNFQYYSYIDELPSLDEEIYNALTTVKNYPGDVQDLCLFFCVDDDSLGKIVTHELVPGGKTMAVTNENKMRYIHLSAQYRMQTQISEQTKAFIRGFRALVKKEWIAMFSAPELQRLISGDNTGIDLDDLRLNTKYFGGFHSAHRVICWLWEILWDDFTPEEHRLFLKFVTSCSSPPLLGFANLEPPFSIRCVEVADDQDRGDTVASFARAFFRVRKRDPVDRLPTSSTCFNLLKLPNYQKKETLKEKLRYAINSNPGFELS
ncbi:ubiquitin-protein ligase E3B [Galendromus occidentalis]|uniref:HECT-type E3 ubiquitin transferase n=1 Tax=Galendromus occidentalis TaxID=34638 RepID=A0AAJ7SH51_9ACAR|nr:ubiquitin-protein ligase E3B [Galendromus occidentalis]